MALSKRCWAILNDIITSKTPVRVEQLSDSYALSPRTIRYDLEMLDAFLKDNGLCLLDKKGGFSFSGSPEDRVTAFTLAEKASSEAFLPENRVGQIISILLKAEGYSTYEDIAQKLDVSKSTVIKEFNEFRSFYPYQSAMVEVVPRHGICFSGNEADIRESIVSFLYKKSSIQNIYHLLQSSTEQGRYARCLRDVVKVFNIKLPDNAFIRLLIYLSVASVRINSGHFIKNMVIREASVECEAAAKMVLTVIAPDIFSNQAEHEYLAGLMGDYFINPSDNRAEIQILLLNVVNHMERCLNLELVHDISLLKTLEADLQAILSNKTLFTQLYENFYNEVLARYSDVFGGIQASVGFIESYIGRTLTQEELISLAIPFVEAVQRSRTLSMGRANILVVCSSGIATSRMLCYQLMSLFDVNIVDAIALNELDNINHYDVDLIVSTVMLGQTEKPNILVGSFLTPKDLDVLKSFLPTKVIDHNLFTTLMKVIEKNCTVHNPKQLSSELTEILNIKGIHEKEKKLRLQDILLMDNILLDIACKDWREAVTVSGAILKQNGYVESAYIEEMIKMIEVHGPYIVIAKGVAMPHAGLKHVNRVGMSLIRLAKPVYFGNSHNNPVDLVFAFCTPTKEMHLEALKQFSLLIDNEMMLNKLRENQEIDEVYKIICDCG